MYSRVVNGRVVNDGVICAGVAYQPGEMLHGRQPPFQNTGHPHTLPHTEARPVLSRVPGPVRAL